MKQVRRTLAVVLVLTLLAEPTWARPAVRVDTRSIQPGIVILVEGIGGVDLLGASAGPAFRSAGLPHEIFRFVWTHGTGRLLTDLQDTQHILKKSHELAQLIRDLRARYPGRPIYVVAKSGGTGLTLFALERLPPDTVDRVVLLSAAVAPAFDLRGALRATRQGIVSFHSRHDQLVLNWGTSQFGTIDRYYGPSAGLNGFLIPTNLNDADHVLYGKLVQVPWQPRMLREGHTGTHVGTSLPGFLSEEVAPWLR
jgi:pimeloyl-ACP methyl ester carboxylesterase